MKPKKEGQSAEKDYPRYDDTMHIDSNATAGPQMPYNETLKGDPKATQYTERYCEEINDTN